MIVDPRLVVGSTWRVRKHTGSTVVITSITRDTVIYYYSDDGWFDNAPINYFLRNWSYIPNMDTELEYL